MADRGYTFAGVCKGVTKARTRCKHIVIYANSYCRQHGGDSTEFMRERLRRLVAKSRAKIKRFKRRLRHFGDKESTD